MFYKKQRLLTEDHSQPGSSSLDDEPSLKKGRRHSRLNVEQTVLKKCIICQNERKTAPKNSSSKHEELTDCATFKAGDTLLNAVKIWEDNRLILALEGQNYIAIEGRYHRTCYQRYTHINKQDKLLERSEEIASEEGSHYDIAFTAVVLKVQEDIINVLEILKMTDLCTFYVGQLKELGLNILGYRSNRKN